MSVIKLTQSYIDALPTPEQGYWINDALLPALRLYIGRSSRTYYITYRNAKGKKDSFKIGDERLFTPIQAREIGKKRLAEVMANGVDLKGERPSARLTIQKILNMYLAAGGSVYYKTMLQGMGEFMDKAPDEITKIDVLTWRGAALSEAKTKIITINKKIDALKRLLNWAEDNELIEKNNLRKLKKAPETDSEQKTNYLSEDDEKRLFAALDDFDNKAREARSRSREHTARQGLPDMEGWAFANYVKPLILVSMFTGMRRNALFSLEWRDVDFENENITLRAATAKNRKVSVIPINSLVKDTLIKWKAQREDEDAHYERPFNALVFPSPQTGTKLNNCNSSWETIRRNAGISPSFRWHDLRHNFASQLVMRGVPINTVRELMTHSDISMTLRYAHLAPEVKRDAVEKLVPSD